MTTVMRVGRDDNAIKCSCGGFAERVDCTEEEIHSEINCGRGYECCCRAFVCSICGKRTTAKAEPPEVE